jgi:putative acetyltransferase
MLPPDYSLLTRTDLEMTAVDGVVDSLESCIQVSSPENPGYYWGNYLLLPGAPEADRLQSWVDLFRDRFQSYCEVEHVLLRWDGAALAPQAQARARALGMTEDSGPGMVATQLIDPQLIEPQLIEPGNQHVEIRPLDFEREFDQIEQLNQQCDPNESSGSPEYRLFKERMRQSWRKRQRAGMVTWWGVFFDEVLVGQCGFVFCSDRLGRYQAVETHPDFRRRGVCSALISTVGQDALGRGGCRALLLGADGEGPALGLYRRLGFKTDTNQRALLLGGDSMVVRLEVAADHAEVRSLVQAAFEGVEEVQLIDQMRDQPGVLSLVAVRSGSILGHALFTPVTSDAAGSNFQPAVALGPIAVRPSQQRQGCGSALIRGGLDRCRDQGMGAAFVLGDPEYYSRFGWRPAQQRQLHCQWPLARDAFQVLELSEGGLDGWQGKVNYAPAFDRF